CLLVWRRELLTDRPSFEGLASIELAPLSEAASGALLDETVGIPVADHVRARLLADARGNPLALVEFSRELSPDHLAGTAHLPELLAVDRKLEAHFRRQVAELPLETQTLVLTAAAQPTGDLALIVRAGAGPRFDELAITPAVTAGLLEVGESIAFRHPLIRSAVYQGASPADRSRAHAALAAASDVEREADQRAWHRGAAAQLPDDDVADELER